MLFFRVSRFGVQIGILISIASAILASKLDAAEIILDGQPCNEACQSWMGVKKNVDNTESTGRVKIDPVLPKDRQEEDDKSKRRSRSKPKLIKAALPKVLNGLPASEPQTMTSTKPVPQDARLARLNVPLPPSRPKHFKDSEAKVVELPRASVPTPAPKAISPINVDSSELGRTITASDQPFASTGPVSVSVSPVPQDANVPVPPKPNNAHTPPIAAVVADPGRVVGTPTEQQAESPSRPEHLKGTEVKVVDLPQASAPTPAPEVISPRNADPSEPGKTASASHQPPDSTAPASTSVSPVLQNAPIAVSPKTIDVTHPPIAAVVADPNRVVETPTEQRVEPPLSAADTASDSLKLAPRPSDALSASLPTVFPNNSDLQGSSLSSDGEINRSVTTRGGSGSTLPLASAEGILSVRLGRIASDSRGTDVHVVVINNLQRAAKSVKVECEATDSQGFKVAESVANFGGIERSDVAFGQVSFPSQIQPENSKFVCVAEEVVAAIEQSRP